MCGGRALIALLQPAATRAENDAVTSRFVVIVAAGLMFWPAGPARAASAALAQSAAPQTAPDKKNHPPPEARVDINHASIEELLKVPGMTASWAGRIVRFRPYRTKQDLLDRGVLPSDVYDRIRDYVIAHRSQE
jgi:competence protein ComEA